MSTKKKNKSKTLQMPVRQGSMNVDPLLQKAIALQNARQFDQAKLIYEDILKNNSNHFDAIHLLGVIYLQREHFDLALDYLNRAVALNPTFADAVFHRGLTYKMQYKLDQALIDYTKALTLNPTHQNALLESGCIYEAGDLLDKSLTFFEKAIEVNNAFVLARLNKVNVLRRLKRFDEALAEIEITLEMAPQYSLAYSTKAMILTDQHHFDLALQLSDKAIALGGNSSELGQLYSQRGIIYRGLWKLDEAASAFQKAIEYSPNLADAYANLGLVFTDQGKLDQALPIYEKGLKIHPSHHTCRFNYAMAKLTAGDLSGGFLQYEWRKNMFQWGTGIEGTEWTGKEWLGGKTILVRCEQGMGDTIQFARYATILASVAEKVILQVQAPLMSIMSSLEGNITLVPEGANLPPHDFYCFLMSLPHLFGTDVTNIPARGAYLTAPLDKVQAWKERLTPYGKKRIGLVWSGGFRADRPELWSVNNRRNIPLETIAQIIDDQFDWFSLQKGEPAESELADYLKSSDRPINLINLTSELKDFSDTAAFIENLDLVVSVDTSTAHLAAALGKPTWILNRFDTCWRWLLNRSDSPWYPSLRLFRQTVSASWTEVIADVKGHLRLFKDGF